MMWVFVGLASIELLVVHLLIAHWSRTAALILSALTLGSIVWLISVIRSFRRLPVLITQDALVMRIGTLKTVAVPLADIAGLREHWDGGSLKQPGVLKLSLIAYPNVMVDLHAPRDGSRKATTLAHRLDDAQSFATALQRALA